MSSAERNRVARNFQDLTGQKFHRLTVLERAANRGNATMWLCRCDCGRIKRVCGGQLKNGRTVSCGCYHREELKSRNTTHGCTHMPEFPCWRSMIDRCDPNSSHPSKKYYADLGVTVCDRWSAEDGFRLFLQDVGRRPTAKHSIDRFPNPNGNYEPGNVRWATPHEQNMNRRNTVRFSDGADLYEKSASCGVKVETIRSRLFHGWTENDAIKPLVRKLIEHDGKSLTIHEWSELTGIPYDTLVSRLKRHWPIHRALTEEVHRKCSGIPNPK